MKISRILTRTALSALFLSVGVNAVAQKYDGVVDKVIAVVGNEAMTLSELESEVKVEQAQGVVSSNIRCEILEHMMQSKLFLVQSRIDSLTVNSDMVEAELSQRFARIRTAFGGDEAAEQYFGKSLYKLRQEWTRQMEEMSLMQQEQQQIAEQMPEVTPFDVQNYVDSADVSSLPVIPIKYKISQICLYPDREAAAMAVREKLISLRERIIAGERFSTLARLYSEDSSNAIKGGEIGMADASVFWPEFSDVALSLKPGVISQVVETPDGFHLIEVIEKNGNMFNARHILMKPQYTDEDREKAFARLDSLRNIIIDSTITFELAARLYSQDLHSRTNGGQMSDPETGSAYFEIDRMKPQDFTAVENLQPGQISLPFESRDNEGRQEEGGRGGNVLYKIVRLDQILPAHVATIEHDYSELLMQVQDIKRYEAIRDFARKKIKETYVHIDPMFMNCDFEDKEWLERASEN